MSEGKTNNNKRRILFLEHYLLDCSDREHPLTVREILEAYQKNGLFATRNTLLDDLKALEAAGLQIETVQTGVGLGYYVANRPFDSTEVMALIDAVSSSQFVSAVKSKEMIRKLASLAIEQDRKDLIATAYAADRIKTDSPSVFPGLKKIKKAVRTGKEIAFNYIEVLPTKEVVNRHHDKVYRVSPYGLIQSDGRYYAPSYDEEKNDIVAYRVDRMRNVRVLDQAADLRLPFHPNEYCRRIVYMNSGDKKPEEVTLLAENYTLIHLMDRFGEHIETSIADDRHVRVVLNVVPSFTFFCWIFQFDAAIRIEGPETVKADYERMLEKTLALQKQGGE